MGILSLLDDLTSAANDARRGIGNPGRSYKSGTSSAAESVGGVFGGVLRRFDSLFSSRVLQIVLVGIVVLVVVMG